MIIFIISQNSKRREEIENKNINSIVDNIDINNNNCDSNGCHSGRKCECHKNQ